MNHHLFPLHRHVLTSAGRCVVCQMGSATNLLQASSIMLFKLAVMIHLVEVPLCPNLAITLREFVLGVVHVSVIDDLL